jgi:hypothetical protein
MFILLLKIQLTIHLSFCVIIHTTEQSYIIIVVNGYAQTLQEIRLQHEVCNVTEINMFNDKHAYTVQEDCVSGDSDLV